jgi:hypothetical protein
MLPGGAHRPVSTEGLEGDTDLLGVLRQSLYRFGSQRVSVAATEV